MAAVMDHCVLRPSPPQVDDLIRDAHVEMSVQDFEMGMRALLVTCMFIGATSASHADQVEDFNAFVQVLAIPVYAQHCQIMMDQDVMDTINADVVNKMNLAGLSEDKGLEIQNQMVEQFGANADCTEGSSDRTNFEAALRDYGGN
jgi:hypothetical protein